MSYHPVDETELNALAMNVQGARRMIGTYNFRRSVPVVLFQTMFNDVVLTQKPGDWASWTRYLYTCARNSYLVSVEKRDLEGTRIHGHRMDEAHKRYLKAAGLDQPY